VHRCSPWFCSSSAKLASSGLLFGPKAIAIDGRLDRPARARPAPVYAGSWAAGSVCRVSRFALFDTINEVSPVSLSRFLVGRRQNVSAVSTREVESPFPLETSPQPQSPPRVARFCLSRLQPRFISTRCAVDNAPPSLPHPFSCTP